MAKKKDTARDCVVTLESVKKTLDVLKGRVDSAQKKEDDALNALNKARGKDSSKANIKKTERAKASIIDQAKAREEMEAAVAAYGMNLEQIAPLVAAMNKSDDVNRLLQANKNWLQKGDDVLFTTFLNGALGGLGTHVLNTKANGALLAYERFAKGGLKVMGAAVTGDIPRTKMQAKILYLEAASFVDTTMDLVKLAFTKGQGWDALMSGDNPVPMDRFTPQEWIAGKDVFIDDQGVERTVRTGKEISSGNLGFQEPGNAVQGGVNNAIDFVGAIIHAPGGALNVMDLSFKTWVYRMEMKRLTIENAHELSNGNEAEFDRVYNLLTKYPAKELMDKAIEAAHQGTFTQHLGANLEKGRKFARVRGIRYAIPFYRTLMNLATRGYTESVFGQVTRLGGGLKTADEIEGGTSYAKSVFESSPKGDATRAQLLASGMITAGALYYLDQSDILEDGFGFTGYLDMSNADDRLQAETIAPQWTYKTQGGYVIDFSQYEPIRTMFASMDGVMKTWRHIDKFNPNGTEIEQEEQLFAIVNGPLEAMWGDHFAVEAANVFYQFVQMVTGDESQAPRATDMVEKWIATLVPRYVGDTVEGVQRVGKVATGEIDWQEAMQKHYQRTDGLLEAWKRKWGINDGLAENRTLYGDVKVPFRALGTSMQYSVFSSKVEPTELDFEMAKLDVEFLDNPKSISVPLDGGGTVKVDMTRQQTEEYMIIGGAGGPLEDLGVSLPSMREHLALVTESSAWNAPMIAENKVLKKKILETVIRERQTAIGAYMLFKHDDLSEQAKNQMIVRRDLLTGELAYTADVTLDYVLSLFSNQQLIQDLEE